MGTRPDNVGEAMDVIGAELRRLQEDGVSDEELERARENVKGRTVLSMESTLDAHEPARQLGADGRAAADASTRCWPRFDAVTLDDVTALARELWAPERLSAAGVGGGRGDLPLRARSGQPGARRGGVINVAVSGAAGRMGETVCGAVEGADDMALVGRADPLLETAPRGRARRRRRGGGLLHARHGAGQRAQLPRGGRALRDGHHRRGLLVAGGRGGRQPVRGAQLRHRRGADDGVRRARRRAHMPECEIVELHHDRKVDAPSGTAQADGRADLARRAATCTSRSTRCGCPGWWRTRRSSSAGRARR